MPRANQPAKEPEGWFGLYLAARALWSVSPWRWMADSDIFGVRDPVSGEIGWCCFIGQAGELAGLIVYRGGKGFSDWRRIQEFEGPEDDGLFGQEALVLYFGAREELSRSERQRIKRLDVKFTEPGAWPQFRSHSHGRIAGELDATEIERLDQTLVIATRMAVESKTGHLDLAPDAEGQLLVRSPQAGSDPLTWIDERIAPPPPIEDPIPQFDQARVERAKLAAPRVNAVWECDVFPIVGQVVREKDRSEYVPACFLLADPAEGAILGTNLSEPARLGVLAQEGILSAVETLGFRPAGVLVVRPRVARALEPLAEALGIPLELVDSFAVLSDMREHMDSFLRRRRR